MISEISLLHFINYLLLNSENQLEFYDTDTTSKKIMQSTFELIYMYVVNGHIAPRTLCPPVRMPPGQNAPRTKCPRTKCPLGHNAPRSKCPLGHNVPPVRKPPRGHFDRGHILGSFLLLIIIIRYMMIYLVI